MTTQHSSNYHYRQHLSAFQARYHLLSFGEEEHNPWEWLAQQYDLRQALDLLEVGCGTGLIWRYLLPRMSSEQTVTLTDYSDDMLTACQRRLDNLNKLPELLYQLEDVHELSFSNNSFDGLFAHQLLSHLDEPELALREITRVLRGGAWAGISLLSHNSLSELFVLAHDIDSRIPTHNPATLLSADQAPELLSQHFASSHCQQFSELLRITDASSIVHHLQSLPLAKELTLTEEFYAEYLSLLTRLINEHGSIHSAWDLSLFICHKEN